MKRGILVFSMALLTIVAASPLTAVQDQQSANSRQSGDSSSVNSQGPDIKDEGERVFEQNCARCHNAPSGFSSRITGTIVRHMRVRANLSRDEEEQLLRYFNQ